MLEICSGLLSIALVATIVSEPKTPPLNLQLNHPPSQSIEIASDLKNGSPRYQLTDLRVLENAFRNQVSNVQVLVLGRVTSILADDVDGDRHQRFIVQLSNSQTLLVAHNIDIAPRVNGLRVGDQLYIYGEYEWNSQGGVIHWTHHDPDRRHVGGWIQRNGRTFQ